MTNHTPLTDQQRYDRRLRCARAITAALKQTHHEWHRLNDGDWRLLGDIAMDALEDVAAERPTAVTSLTEAVTALEAHLEDFFRAHPEERQNSPWVCGWKDATAEVRRMAVEVTPALAPTKETP